MAMDLSWRDLPAWQKALVLGGGAAAAAGLLYYLVRDAEDEEEEAEGCGPVQELPPGIFFKVSDPRGANVGLRTRPDTAEDARCGEGMVLRAGEKFEVSAVVEGSDGQKFLKLADGRGWAFTQSAKDGRTLCQPAPPEAKASPEEQLEEIKGLFPPGEYRLINEGYPTAEASTESPDVGELPPGTIVNITEVAVLLEEKRVRGRIEEPAGWLSLLKLDDGYRWVVPAKLPSMDDLPANSRQRMMFEQLKQMFKERAEVLEQVVEQAKTDLTMFPEFGKRLAAGEEPTQVAAEYQMAMMMVSGMGGRGGP